MINKQRSFNLGFTIVELLVVIVVIGIVATVTLISFAGISSKAVVATLQSDLTNARRSILNFQAQSTTSSFPTSITACPTPGATELCLTPTAGNTFSYVVNNSVNPQTFGLTATNGSTKYYTNDNNAIINVPGSIVTDGLVLNLDAGNPASYPGTGITWYDLSGNGNNGTLVNGVGFSTANSGSMVFDGVNDYIPVGSVYSFADSFTLEVAFNANVAGTTSRVLAGKYSGSGADYWVGVGSNNKLSFSLGAPSAIIINSSNVVNDNKWRIATCAYNKQTNSTYLYINSNLNSSSSSITANVGTPNGNLVIGDFGDYRHYPFSGSIGFMNIYNRALSQSEITQNFNALRGRYGI